MVDVDGVLITHPHAAGWAEHLNRDLGIRVEDLQRVFFEPHWNDVVHGRASLRESLTPALAQLAPQITYDDFREYWFSNDAKVNICLLNELAVFRRNGIDVHLATVQEHERASYLWNELAFRDHFDAMHYSAALGKSKPRADFYQSIEVAVGLKSAAIFFIDDNQENVTAARKCGWTAAAWTGRDTLADLILQQAWNGV
ncbi:HAD-IA family hydrolase [Sphingomonas sp. BE138]|uniref:HAD-IA family hydrolase n=1 Tax=Sphingomonas sp. BE138 TaxID=2817845 RepID=UPI00286C0BAA|nr:HAD-IA family hydrolase [Sphingomonas sp. BE138]